MPNVDWAKESAIGKRGRNPSASSAPPRERPYFACAYRDQVGMEGDSKPRAPSRRSSVYIPTEVVSSSFDTASGIAGSSATGAGALAATIGLLACPMIAAFSITSSARRDRT